MHLSDTTFLAIAAADKYKNMSLRVNNIIVISKKNESIAPVSRVLCCLKIFNLQFSIFNLQSSGSACHLSTACVATGLQRSTLHRVIKMCVLSKSIPRAGYPNMAVVYMNLQPPAGTARRSPAAWWSLTPPSHPYPHGGGRSLLPLPAVADCFYFQKWSALCCPDFPPAMPTSYLV